MRRRQDAEAAARHPLTSIPKRPSNGGPCMGEFKSALHKRSLYVHYIREIDVGYVREYMSDRHRLPWNTCHIGIDCPISYTQGSLCLSLNSPTGAFIQNRLETCFIYYPSIASSTIHPSCIIYYACIQGARHPRIRLPSHSYAR